MGRPHRFDEAGYAQHIVQRGNGRHAIFLEPEDRQDFLDLLAYALRRFGGALHAYVLMTNHVHLLFTPQERGGAGRLMHVLSGHYARGFNRRNQRTGTLWEGRYRASTIDSESYFFACSRYIELNPVRAQLAAHPGDYPWSSHRGNAMNGRDRLLTPHPLYLALGRDRAERQRRYAALFERPVASADLDALREATARCRPLGNDRFHATLSQSSGQPTRSRQDRPGTPRHPPQS